MKRKVTQLDVAQKYFSLVQSASKRNLKINLSLRDIKHLLAVTHCEITGVKLQDEQPNHSTYRTVDRMDSTLGYVKGNVFAVCNAYNAMKNSYFEQTKVSGELANTSREDTKKIFKALSEL